MKRDTEFGTGEMAKAPVRVAILGFGLHAVRRLLPSFPRATDSVLVGMWRRDQTKAAQDCRQHGIAHCFSSREELCASHDVDAVFITSPDAMHLEDVLLAVKHGKAVLCEKPLAMNAAEAKQMAEAAKSAGVVFGVAQNFRWNRSVSFMREQVASGAIGTVQMAQAQFCYAAQNSARKWIADGSLAMGGPIGDVGVHSVDALRYIVQAEVESVSTLAAQDAFSGGVEAYASMQMRMTGGIFAHVVANARTPYRTLIEVSGSEGLLSSENGFTVDQPVEVVLRKGGKIVETTSFDNSDGYALMLDSFAAAVRGKAAFAATGEDGVRNMLVLDAAYRSWKSGLPERVE